MTIISSRRGFITGLVALVAAPAIVRVASIMPVKSVSWSTDDIVELLSHRIDAAEEAMRNNLMQSIYGDMSPGGELFGTVMNADLSHIGDRSGAPMFRHKSVGVSLTVHG